MDVVDLGEFYAGRLGNTTKRVIANRLKSKFGALNGATVMGLGYCLPYLEEGTNVSRRCVSFMLARQGVVQWPYDGPVRSALVDECELPLLESTIDLALVIHGLELTDAPDEMLKEVWRVMAPQGRLLLVVPNRRGMWASFDTSPFGYGQPFSRPQLTGLLKEAQFTVVSWSHALFLPPMNRGIVLSLAGVWEETAGRVMPGLGGVSIVEAVKQVYAISTGKRVRRLVPRLRPGLAPAPVRRFT